MLANCFFSRDPERPFDTERPRNWGSFGAELNGLKPWRRGGFRCFLGGWLVVENASKLSFFYRDPERGGTRCSGPKCDRGRLVLDQN